MAGISEKRCKACQEIKPVEDFYLHSQSGRPVTNCKVCHVEASKARHAAAKGSLRQRRMERDKVLRVYGMSGCDFTRMLIQQDGVCAICGFKPAGNLHVDHDHGTGKVRGLLCRLCNTAIGKFHDSPSRMRDAAAYLERAI